MSFFKWQNDFTPVKIIVKYIQIRNWTFLMSLDICMRRNILAKKKKKNHFLVKASDSVSRAWAIKHQNYCWRLNPCSYHSENGRKFCVSGSAKQLPGSFRGYNSASWGPQPQPWRAPRIGVVSQRFHSKNLTLDFAHCFPTSPFRFSPLPSLYSSPIWSSPSIFTALLHFFINICPSSNHIS